MGPFDFEQLTQTSAGAPINWATLIALGIGDIVAIDFMQRIFAARSPETAQKSCFTGAAGTAIIGVAFAMVALSASSVLGLTTDDGPILFQLLDDYAPSGLTVLVLSGIVAASFSTASGAILATSAVAVRNIFGVRRVVSVKEEGVRDPLLLWTRVAMIPIVVLGVSVALKVAQTGILLTLAFDLMLAGLLVPFILGLFWKRGGTRAAVAALVVGVTRPPRALRPHAHRLRRAQRRLVHPERPDRRVVRRLADVLGLRRLAARLPGRRGDLAAHRDRGGLGDRGRHARRDGPGTARARARRLTGPRTARLPSSREPGRSAAATGSPVGWPDVLPCPPRPAGRRPRHPRASSSRTPPSASCWPRSGSGYYEAVQEFLVVEARATATVIGCGALHVMWQDLAEIRTLAVDRTWRGTGVGHALLDALLDVPASWGCAGSSA